MTFDILNTIFLIEDLRNENFAFKNSMYFKANAFFNNALNGRAQKSGNAVTCKVVLLKRSKKVISIRFVFMDHPKHYLLE